MPWNLAVCALVLGGCLFDADYSSGGFKCSDGQCPSGLACRQNVCTSTPAHDAHPDSVPDAAHDAPTAALTCVDPGPFPVAGGTAMGTTTGRTSTISSSCGGVVMNGPDAVYRIALTAGAHLTVGITGLEAYVIAPCTVSPTTPICIGNSFATPGNPTAFIAPASGSYFIVVDHQNAGTTGPYGLTLTVN